MSATGGRRVVADICSVIVTCQECGRSKILFPNDDRRRYVDTAMPAEAYLKAICCAECRTTESKGKQLVFAAVWTSPDTVDARAGMARLFRTG